MHCLYVGVKSGTESHRIIVSSSLGDPVNMPDRYEFGVVGA